MASEQTPSAKDLTAQDLPALLRNDSAVKLAGVDVDGMLRGKLVAKTKFLSVAETGFGFCSVIFGWDMHDTTYGRELMISNKQNGYRDLLARVDLASFRRIPWEDDVPFFLVSFLDPDTNEPVSACPRGLLKKQVDKLRQRGYGAKAGGKVDGYETDTADSLFQAEYEFFQFKIPPNASDPSTRSTAAFLDKNSASALPCLSEGMFGYSLTRPVQNKEYYYDLFHTATAFGCGIESWHTESGPGVYEAALEFTDVAQMADRACLFKYVVKSVATRHGIQPCFMAKPRQGLPGSSGHVHVSLVDGDGNNVLARDRPDAEARYPDIRHLSDVGRHFLAGILDGLPDLMPLLAPTINSYKRLVENFWAPVTVSWGLEHRAASIRLIAPPTCKPAATRLEVRVPGADTNAYYVLAAILALGWRGVEKKLEIAMPPLGKGEAGGGAGGGAGDGDTRLARDLREATSRFARKESIAREVFGDEFVDHFGGTREHEMRLWEEAVTDWEIRRYIENV